MAKIIVVNNDTAFLTLMSDLLTEEGYDTTVLPVSDQAYALIREQKPDLVILDVGSESTGAGWTVLNLLRLDPETANIPVIVASVDSSMLKAKAEVLESKNCQILEKPFALDELLRRIKSILDWPSRAGGVIGPLPAR